jgi:CheY-like chemotaxis protein
MLNQLSYLYLEDDPLSREIMQMILGTGMGVESLVIFEDSQDFANRLKALNRKIDVFLLDIHITPDDGFKVLEMLRADPTYQKARIIALTASVMNEEVEKLRRSGFDAAIGKPISIQSFPELLGRVLNGETVWHVV